MAALTGGWLAQMRGRLPEAVSRFEAVLHGDFSPEQRALAALGRAHTLIWMGRFDEGQAALRQLMDLFPASTLVDDAARDLGWIEVYRGNVAAAEAAFVAAAALSRSRARFSTGARGDGLDWRSIFGTRPRELLRRLEPVLQRSGGSPARAIMTVLDRFAAEDAEQNGRLPTCTPGGRLTLRPHPFRGDLAPQTRAPGRRHRRLWSRPHGGGQANVPSIPYPGGPRGTIPLPH
jgi:hypothetical protein